MKFARWLTVLLVIGAVGAGDAWADRGSHRGGHRGGGHGHFNTWAGVGLTALVLGAALYPRPVYAAPPYYPAYYPPTYYPPVIAVEPAPPVYADPPPVYAPPVAQGPRSNDWYYCPASKSYYPYVRDCPNGWQRVPAYPVDY